MSLDRRYLVAPVHKAMQLLDAMVASKEPMTLSDLAACTALPKTTTFRYLYTLRASGFVGYDGLSERYTIGSRVTVSTPLSPQMAQLRDAAHPALRRLQRQFNETVNLAVRDGSNIIYLDMVGSTRLQHTEAMIGKRDSIYSTALGKALLLNLGASELERMVPRQIPARTPHTITDRSIFLDNIAQSAQRHYAFDLEENELGAHCVAAAICSSYSGEAIAAISISGPSQLMTMETLNRMGRALARTASQLETANRLQ